MQNKTPVMPVSNSLQTSLAKLKGELASKKTRQTKPETGSCQKHDLPFQFLPVLYTVVDLSDYVKVRLSLSWLVLVNTTPDIICL